MLRFQPATQDQPKHTLIIAEIGVNHDGEPAKAVTLIEEAARAGADAVKLQYFHAERLLSKAAELAAYQAGTAESPKQLLRRLELPLEVFPTLADRARAAGVRLIVTPFSLADVDDLNRLHRTRPGGLLDALKIASPDAINTPLIRAALSVGEQVIVSTGTCTLEELKPALALLEKAPLPNNQGHALMHCVSAYPTPLEQAGLHGMLALKQVSPLPYGYSDHTDSIQTGAWAAMMGAAVLEKHLTYDTQALGPDHTASLDPQSFAAYVQQVRSADRAAGPATKSPGALENDVKNVSRQSVCFTRNLPAGHTLTPEDLTLKRPGTGIHPDALDQLPGKRLRESALADMPAQASQIDL